MLEMPHFVFMDNYINLLLSDDLFLTACKNTFIFGMVTGPVCYALSFFMAWFINELPPKLRAIVTLIFYAPSISGNATLVFNLAFSGDSYGYINGFLINLGVIDSPIQFLTDAFWIKPMCIIAGLRLVPHFSRLSPVCKVYREICTRRAQWTGSKTGGRNCGMLRCRI